IQKEVRRQAQGKISRLSWSVFHCAAHDPRHEAIFSAGEKGKMTCTADKALSCDPGLSPRYTEAQVSTYADRAGQAERPGYVLWPSPACVSTASSTGRTCREASQAIAGKQQPPAPMSEALLLVWPEAQLRRSPSVCRLFLHRSLEFSAALMRRQFAPNSKRFAELPSSTTSLPTLSSKPSPRARCLCRMRS